MRTLVTAGVVLAIFAGGVAAQTRIWEGDIRREDVASKRRQTLNQMELRPFAADGLSSLSNWTGGSALTSDAMKDKVVLIFTFAAWEPNSQKAFDRAARLAAANVDKGLIVVAVHGQNRWDDAVTMAKQADFKGLLAQDDGKLRAKLMVDQDPDFYVIDRAGNLRFSDIETDVVNRGVERALGETAETAASQLTLFKAQLAKEKREFDAPVAITELLRPKNLKVEFQLPGAEAYDKAAWPQKNKSQDLGANDLQEQKFPDAEAFGTKQLWLTPKPDWNGKVIILDFWATWCVPCKRSTPVLEDLQRKNMTDLQIIGVTGLNEFSDKEVRAFLAKADSPYAHMYDFKTNEQNQTMIEKLGVRAIPHVMIISTDGVVRWQGNPLAGNFRTMAELIIEVDPGIKARRAAESAALKAAEDAAAGR